MAKRSICSMASSIRAACAFAAAAMCAFIAPLTARADGAKRPMALVVMVDGMRADAVESGCMPNLCMLKEGRWHGNYKKYI